MSEQARERNRIGPPPEAYERFFVPAIGGPLAGDLVEAAALRPGERVLDVACGTGAVARLAAERVGAGGAVAGLDVNPAMLAVARAGAPAGLPIEWHQASAEAMPLPDGAFDVALCQMGLQFVPDRAAALRDMRRVLGAQGRAFLTLPGPTPEPFAILAEALARHLGPPAAAFVELVFSLHEPEALAELLRGAGFREVEVRAERKALRLPPPADFLWQYLYATPLAEAAAGAEAAALDALEREVCAQWRGFADGGSLTLQLGVTTASARR